MFDTNQFKRDVKEWFRLNPNGSVEDLADFCEEKIPPQNFSTHQWLIEQTIGWYSYVLEQRKQRIQIQDEEH